jgi:DNA-directed RNA polymerase subunit RPC12/RpoP
VSAKYRVCPHCGSENRSIVHFCETCGKELSAFESVEDAARTEEAESIRCPHCGAENRAGLRFCETCGEEMRAAEEAEGATESVEGKESVPCPSCGAENRTGVLFCETCGESLAAPVEQKCPACGALNRSDVLFCENCGEQLEEIAKPKPVRKPIFQRVPVWAGALGALAAAMVCVVGGWATLDFIGVFDTTSRQPRYSSAPVRSAPTSTSRPPVISQPDQNEPTEPSYVPPTESLEPTSIPETEPPSSDDHQLPPGTTTHTQPAFESSIMSEGPGVYSIAGSSSADSDDDGLSDAFEKWIVDAFHPHLYFDEGECMDPYKDLMRLYQVTPVYFPYDAKGYDGPWGVLLTFVVAYKRDCGDPVAGINDHWGDSEAMRMLIASDRENSSTWRVMALMISRHYDPWEYYETSEFRWVDGTHPIVWVSENKHAAYSSHGECSEYSLTGLGVVRYEDCGSSLKLDYTITEGMDGFNVGERYSHIIDEIPSNGLGLFSNEFVWDDVRFCGGRSGANRPDCAGEMTGMWWYPIDDSGDPDEAREREQTGRLGEIATKEYLEVYGGNYVATIFTGDVDYAGTNLDVDITIVSELGWEHTLRDLDTPDHNDFERDSDDSFEIGPAYIGPITQVKIHVYDSGEVEFLEDTSEWYLDRVEIYDRVTGVTHIFRYGSWLDNPAGWDPEIDQVTLWFTVIP